MDGSSLGYAELLRLAVSHGLQELSCSIAQFPGDANGHHAVVVSTARAAKCSMQAVGEARRDSLPANRPQFELTVAEHRARVRVLCDIVGMPQTLDETLVCYAGLRREDSEQTRDSLDRDVRSREPEAVTRPTDGTHSPTMLPKPPPPTEPISVAGAKQPLTEIAIAEDAGPAGKQHQVIKVAAAPATGDVSITAQPPSRAIQTGTLGPDIVARLLKMTRRKADAEGMPISEEEAMDRLNSFFQRAFGHALSEGTRMEGQRVVQRLASELARIGAEQSAVAD